MKTNIQRLYEHFFPATKQEDAWLKFPEFLLSKSPDEPLTEESIADWHEEMLEELRKKHNASH